jgi:hypothetical protein
MDYNMSTTASKAHPPWGYEYLSTQEQVYGIWIWQITTGITLWVDPGYNGPCQGINPYWVSGSEAVIHGSQFRFIECCNVNWECLLAWLRLFTKIANSCSGVDSTILHVSTLRIGKYIHTKGYLIALTKTSVGSHLYWPSMACSSSIPLPLQTVPQ